MVKGEIIPQERCYKNEDVVRYLSNLLDRLLSTYTEKEQLRFKKSPKGGYHPSMLGRLFGITDQINDFDSNWHKHDHSTATHVRIVEACLKDAIAGWRTGKMGKVTKEIAIAAFNKVQAEVLAEKEMAKRQRQAAEKQAAELLANQGSGATVRPEDAQRINETRAERLADLIMGTDPVQGVDKWEFGNGPDAFPYFLREHFTYHLDHVCPEMSTCKDRRPT